MKTKSITPGKGRFVDKVVLITGGTSGIGLEVAKSFSEEKARAVIVCGRSPEKWEIAKKTLPLKNKIEYQVCDIRIEEQVKNLIESIYDKYGRLDVCFNNAGVQPGVSKDGGLLETAIFDSSVDKDGSIVYRIPAPQPKSPKMTKAKRKSQTTTISQFAESEIATSCIGTFYCLKWEIGLAFARQPKHLSLSIINTSSRNGVLPDSKRILYAASKAFILSMTRSTSSQAAQRCVSEGRAMIRVNAISPGPVDTPLEFAAFGFPVLSEVSKDYKKYSKSASAGVPMRRTASPKEIAPLVLFLADEKSASYITGANMCVDGGHTASPVVC
jgi:NAD(P)-dependent dehydrogenase (short-subunit alcohol dehydrogenase family)